MYVHLSRERLQNFCQDLEGLRVLKGPNPLCRELLLEVFERKALVGQEMCLIHPGNPPPPLTAPRAARLGSSSREKTGRGSREQGARLDQGGVSLLLGCVACSLKMGS